MQKEAWRNLPKYSARLGEQAAVAEQLYDVLADPAVTRRRLPVLLAANKADCGARAHARLYSQAPREGARRAARHARRARVGRDRRRREGGASARVAWPLLVFLPLHHPADWSSGVQAFHVVTLSWGCAVPGSPALSVSFIAMAPKVP